MTMKNRIKTWMLAAFILAPASFSPVFAQASSQVAPRVTLLVSNLTITKLTLTNPVPGQAVFVTNQTYLPFSSAHPMGLWAQVLPGTNGLGNANVTIYPTFAYDTAGGNSNAINQRYGTNWLNPATNYYPFTWTFPCQQSNSFTAGTNLVSAVWEPATAWGIWGISNGCASNITINVWGSIVP
jgi:hypothetical protein